MGLVRMERVPRPRELAPRGEKANLARRGALLEARDEALQRCLRLGGEPLVRDGGDRVVTDIRLVAELAEL